MRIRKNSILEDLYLSRQGIWVEYRLAAKFSNIIALKKFASIYVYGIF